MDIHETADDRKLSQYLMVMCGLMYIAPSYFREFSPMSLNNTLQRGVKRRIHSVRASLGLLRADVVAPDRGAICIQ